MLPPDFDFSNLNEQQLTRLLEFCTFVPDKFASYKQAEVAQRPAPDGLRLFQPLSKTTSTATFGPLDRLPWEVLCEVMLGCDLATLIAISQTSRRARDIIADIPQIRAIGLHAVSLLGVSITLRVASFITARSVWHTMLKHRCHNCEHIGEFVQFHPHIVRVCHFCIEGICSPRNPIADTTYPQHLAHVSKRTGKPVAALQRSMFCMLTKPSLVGDYKGRNPATKRRWVVTGKEASDACKRAGVRNYTDCTTPWVLSRQTTTDLPFYNFTTRDSHQVVACMACGSAVGCTDQRDVKHMSPVLQGFRRHALRCPKLEDMCKKMTTFQPHILGQQYIARNDK